MKNKFLKINFKRGLFLILLASSLGNISSIETFAAQLSDITIKQVASNPLDEYNSEDENIIKITHGFICKPPIFRKTPLGRDITDLMVAVNRQYIKSDYIPCIVWNEDAVLAASLQVGDEIQFKGRIQSREYIKKPPDSGKEEE